MTDFEKYIRNVADFPVKGIQFKDITTLLREGEVFASAVDYLYDPFRQKEIQKIVGIESRGFIFGAALAYKLNIGFIPIRKPGKLPSETFRVDYKLEYGEGSLEIHKDGIRKNEKVLLIDDLLATGGTAKAACDLIKKTGGRVEGVSFLIELSELDGRKLLGPYDVHSLLQL